MRAMCVGSVLYMDVINISTEINYAIDYDRAATATTFARHVRIDRHWNASQSMVIVIVS